MLVRTRAKIPIPRKGSALIGRVYRRRPRSRKPGGFRRLVKTSKRSLGLDWFRIKRQLRLGGFSRLEDLDL